MSRRFSLAYITCCQSCQSMVLWRLCSLFDRPIEYFFLNILYLKNIIFANFVYKFFCFRLPQNLLEKMPSATNSPLVGRKSIPTVPRPPTGSGTETTDQVVPPQQKHSRNPLSVASMVRRFENSDSKSRAGTSATFSRSGSAAFVGPKSPGGGTQGTPLSSRTSSMSSSQGLLDTVGSSAAEGNCDSTPDTLTTTTTTKVKNLGDAEKKKTSGTILPMKKVSVINPSKIVVTSPGVKAPQAAKRRSTAPTNTQPSTSVKPSRSNLVKPRPSTMQPETSQQPSRQSTKPNPVSNAFFLLAKLLLDKFLEYEPLPKNHFRKPHCENQLSV